MPESFDELAVAGARDTRVNVIPAAAGQRAALLRVS
jgi:hypothetical protein